MKKRDYEKRFASLKSEANTWTQSWKEISRFIKPTRGFFNDQPNNGRAIDHKTILDGHAGRQLRTLASGMTSGLTSPSRPWFRLGLADRDLMQFRDVKIWLEIVQERMESVYSRSNIYGVLHSMYEELALFGTSACMVLSDPKTTIRGRNFTAGEYFLGTSSDGTVDSFAREYWMTVNQLVHEFGYDSCSSQTKSSYDRNEGDVWVKINHLIEPNHERDMDLIDNKNKPFRSVYWEQSSDANEVLRISGFDEFPVLAPRWDLTTTADFYGKGPGWDAIGDVKMLQKLQKDKLIALDKLINPPMQMDASIQGEANTLPGGITRFNASVPNGGIKPAYQINPDLNAMEFSIEKTQAAISSTFYSDLFLMIAMSDRRQVTAREIAEKHEEKLLVLGPVLERLEGELLDPLISRTFSIMWNAGMIPTPPQELSGMSLDVQYTSMLAQAQRMVGTTAIEQAASFAGSLSAVKPEVLDVLNGDQFIQQYAELLGVDPRLINSPEEVAAIRKARSDAQAAQTQAQQTAGLVNGAKTLSETKIGQNSVLDAILNNRK